VISLLNDWRGQETGRLLLLRDVTEQKRAQAQLLEQQQVVATLQERERLARELHDNLGQVLGYVSMQAQAIRKRVRDGDLTPIEPQLTQLAQVAQEAHKEIRDSIFGLKSSPAEQWSFINALRQHLETCQEHYGLRTELVIPTGFHEDAFGQGAGVQLLRVIQEAVNNARKHGRAGCVRVSFEVVDHSARITVADDGFGFDPQQLKKQAEGHYGLAFMHERMAQIGGVLRFDSTPGKGTQVIIEVPLYSEQ
jgi:signal transduction histidine kinase